MRILALLVLVASAALAQSRPRISSPPDTCSGGGPCAIGASGISTDGGVVALGVVPNLALNTTAGLYNFSTGPAGGICLGADVGNDGGSQCMGSFTADTTSRVLSIGTNNTTPKFADGGVTALKTISFTVDTTFDGGSNGLILFNAGTKSGQGVKYNTLTVPVFHGTATAPQAFECNTGTFSGGARAVSFATNYDSVPICHCTDTSGGSAGAPVGCSTDVPLITGFNAFGIGTNTFSWCCVGPR